MPSHFRLKCDGFPCSYEAVISQMMNSLWFFYMRINPCIYYFKNKKAVLGFEACVNYLAPKICITFFNKGGEINVQI